MKRIALILTLTTAACASHTGVMPAGTDTYMVSNQGWISTQSEGELLAASYKEASAYCASIGKKFVPVSSASRAGTFGRGYPEANLTFRCVSEGDPELARPVMTPTPTVRIENSVR